MRNRVKQLIEQSFYFVLIQKARNKKAKMKTLQVNGGGGNEKKLIHEYDNYINNNTEQNINNNKDNNLGGGNHNNNNGNCKENNFVSIATNTQYSGIHHQQQLRQQHNGTLNISNNNSNNNNGNSGGGGGSSCNVKNRICRDFVRSLCRRKHCRYPHVLSPDLVVFCHDFQNSSCPRINCKFLHYTLHEEEYYRKYGEFPQEQQHINENGPLPPLPTCKDYRMFGSCRHRDCYLAPLLPSLRIDRDSSMWNDHHIGYRQNERSIVGSLGEYRVDEYQALKRSRDSLDGPSSFKRFREDTDRFDIMAVIKHFEEEQIMLRRRVEANEIKIAELRASNEYLIAQNAQLRLNNVQQQQQQQSQQQQQQQQQQQSHHPHAHHPHHQGPPQQPPQQCSSTVVNPVTVTQTTSQTQQNPPPTGAAPRPPPQVMSGVSIAPVQVQATPIVSIAAPQTQIIANSAPPIALAANTSQGQQLAAIAQQNITSLSSTSQPLAPTHTQQILGTSQITLAPAIAQGPSMGLTINTSQALAMSNATQPIISYPVMTHSILPH